MATHVVEYDFKFEEIKSDVIGDIKRPSADELEFVMYGHNAPLDGEKMLFTDDKVYICTRSNDVTSEDEKEQGLSFAKVRFEFFDH